MYWYGCPSQLFPVGYKNTPFPKQYTILSNKWGAVQSRAAVFIYLNRQLYCQEAAPLLLRGTAGKVVQRMPNSFLAGGGVVMASSR